MTQAKATKVRSIDLGVLDLDKSMAFYSSHWGLHEVARQNGSVYLRANDGEHHAVALHVRPQAGMISANFAADDGKAVDCLYEKAKAKGVRVASAPAELPAIAGGGYGFACLTPEGMGVTISADVARHENGAGDKTTPGKFSHVVFRTSVVGDTEDFFVDLFGFKVSDRTDGIHFLRCASDHHSVALAKVKGPGLHHFAFELADLDSLMRASGRMQLHGYELGHGVGRHAGPGNNVFSFFVDPNGFAVEYTTEMDQIDDSYPERSAEYWGAMPLRPCAWGMAMRQTETMRRAKSGALTDDLNRACTGVISEAMHAV